ncbi:citrate synthase [Acarospora aff. strigata]|nr:citrate synthase [Acarospora aff. strigata]
MLGQCYGRPMRVSTFHHLSSAIMPSAAPVINGTSQDSSHLAPTTNGSYTDGNTVSANDNIRRFAAASRPMSPHASHTLFHNKTRCLVYGLQPRAVQGMLDFDFICKRKTPSVAGIIYTFGGQFVSKMYWGTSETLLPVYQDVDKAMAKHSDVDTIVNFASSRSVYSSTMDLMDYPQIKSIAIIAEGVPERRAREILHVAKKKGITIIGPATVGGIKPGAFKIGNTGGMMDNIVASKLYRKGSVGYVSKSGGMSNELNNIIANRTDGVYEGVAIGGDRYPGTTFIDHMLRYQADPECKMLLLLGEVGGVEEYRVIEAVKSGVITKPVVAWAIGTCASMFKTEVQFGHAGSFANSQLETAAMKNKSMKEAGIFVPDTFEEMPDLLAQVYQNLVKQGTVKPQPEPVPPKIPIDYSWAQELGLIRKPAAFISTISDDRGQELLYAGMPISDVFKEEIGIGGVMSLLWFRRRLPEYASRFLEMVLMLTADHGPAVSGAMNTIITTRAGKDLISALVSGLLTIGSRFGGALDGAAEEFTKAFDKGLSPRDFVDTMRKENKLIPGIGHKVKSRNNPDLRVELVKEFVKKRFPSCKMLEYAIAVETVTTSKKDNLILNVDGCVAVCFVDLMRNCGAFSPEEAENYLNMGVLNGLFVLGRSIGLIAHYLDQKRLRTGLYRHPWDDITYLLPNLAQGGNVGKEGRVEVSL